MSTLARVRKLVVKHLGVKAASVTKEARFSRDLGAKPNDLIELVMAFEEEFGIQVPEGAEKKLSTVKDAVALIEANQG